MFSSSSFLCFINFYLPFILISLACLFTITFYRSILICRKQLNTSPDTYGQAIEVPLLAPVSWSAWFSALIMRYPGASRSTQLPKFENHVTLSFMSAAPTVRICMHVWPIIQWSEIELTAHNWQKWKRVFLTCPCHKIYRDEAVGLKSCKYTWKITIFVKMWILGQYRENLIFCQNCLIEARI